MKLNVGCGNIPLENYINEDLCYYPGTKNPLVNKKLAKTWNQDHPHSPWIYGDATNMIYQDSTFDEIICVHTLEHLNMNDGNQTLKKMYEILKPEGFVEIEVPDLLKACELAKDVHIKLGENNTRWFRIMGLFNGTTGDDGEGQYHLCMYTKEYLEFRMKEQGFRDIKEIDVGFGHGRPEPDYNFRLKGYK